MRPQLGGSADDWARLRDAWGETFGERLRLIGQQRLSLRVRMLGGTHTGYARLTRRWWEPVSAKLAGAGLTERPLYFVSSNSHSLVNIVTGIARDREPELVAFVEQLDDDDILRQELAAFREGRSQGYWENFLYFVARLYFDDAGPRPRPSAAPASSSAASPTCGARPRCGCPPRSSRWTRSTPGRSIRGSARSTPRRSPRAAR